MRESFCLYMPYSLFEETVKILKTCDLWLCAGRSLSLLHAINKRYACRYWIEDSKDFQLWRQYPVALATFGLTCLTEYSRRGFTILQRSILPGLAGHMQGECVMPPWLVSPVVQQYYRRRLVCIDKEYYGQFFSEA